MAETAEPTSPPPADMASPATKDKILTRLHPDMDYDDPLEVPFSVFFPIIERLCRSTGRIYRKKSPGIRSQAQSEVSQLPNLHGHFGDSPSLKFGN
jgi:hypothetical protein